MRLPLEPGSAWLSRCFQQTTSAAASAGISPASRQHASCRQNGSTKAHLPQHALQTAPHPLSCQSRSTQTRSRWRAMQLLCPASQPTAAPLLAHAGHEHGPGRSDVRPAQQQHAFTAWPLCADTWPCLHVLSSREPLDSSEPKKQDVTTPKMWPDRLTAISA